MDAIVKDKRFAQIAKDPRFHRMKRKDRMVKIDKRFHGMFEDDRFKLKYTVDKRGRPVRTTTNEDLQKYYDLSDSEDSEESEEENEKVKKKKKKIKPEKKKKISQDDSNDEESEKSKKIKSVDMNVKKGKASGKVKVPEPEEESEEEDVSDDGSEEDKESLDDDVDLARGQGNEETSSSSDDDSEEGEEDLARGEGNVETSSDDSDSEETFEDDKFDHKWGELDKTAPAAEEITSRLAVCHMDWDRVKAKDLFVLFSSFIPAGGVIKSVSVYPSEYGKERMAEEEVRGPKELVEHGAEEDVEEGSKEQREKMRQYQLNRLRYYYAVVECDTAETANSIYEQCDGIEYESSATKIDLRFIPTDMEFDDKPTSVATSIPNAATYKPAPFTTTALQQSKVDLTWDETDKERTAVTMRKFTKDELEELDMKDYLASSSGSEDDEDPYGGFIEQPTFGTVEKDDNDEAVLEQYKEILNVAKKKEKKEKKSDVGMEISWDPGLIEEAEEKVRQKTSGPDTPWEQYLNKKKDKKKTKKKTDTSKEKSQEPQESKKSKKNTKNKKTKEPDPSDDDDDDANDSEADKEGGDAFSDDELPSDMDLDDDYFKEEMQQGAEGQKGAAGNKKKKKGKKRRVVSEEEQKSKAELSLLLMDEDDDRQHFSLKGIMEKEGADLSKTKKKKLKRLKKKLEKDGVKQEEDTFNVNVSDPRFADIYDNPLYNIDPSAPEYKATKATSALIGEKLKRRAQQPVGGASGKKRPLGGSSGTPAKQARTEETDGEGGVSANKDLALASLVKSVKAKTQTLHKKKHR